MGMVDAKTSEAWAERGVAVSVDVLGVVRAWGVCK